jgi:hypothetical protein
MAKKGENADDCQISSNQISQIVLQRGEKLKICKKTVKNFYIYWNLES